MKAVGITRPLPDHGPESLLDLELPRPEPNAHDLLVEVRAISVNPVDTKVRRNREPPRDRPLVLGWDAAGVVVGVGPAVTLFKVGDEVYFAGDLTRPGANSELCVVDERIAGPKPKRTDFARAAAMPLTALTAYEALFQRMRMGRGDASRGQSLLVIGGAGGVGSIAVQLAKVLTKATVIASASRVESAEWVRDLGADHVIDHHEPLPAQLAQLGLEHVDYTFCTADSDPYFPKLFEVAAPQSALCFIVTPKRPVDLAPAQSKSLAIHWELMFTRPIFQTDDMIEQHRILRELAELMDAGRVRSTLTRRIVPISARTLREAHAELESGRTIGKIVLEGWP